MEEGMRKYKYLLMSLALSLCFFEFDLYMPLGVAAGVLHVIAVVVSFWSTDARHIFITAAAATIFTALDYFLTPSAVSAPWVVVTNRSMSLLAIWATAVLVFRLKSREESLKRTQAELSAVNKELEAFCYSVSHDLRAPLRAADGFSQALVEDCGSQLDEQGKDHLKRIRAACQRMGQLIDDLLRLSRVSREQMELKPVNLTELARQILNELKSADPSRNVEISVEEGLTAKGDNRLLRVALENLFRNAWKFTRKRAAAKIEFGSVSDNGRPAYFVRDNGAGFDMAYAGKLFGTFQRLHAASDFEGEGIGLATVQRIIHRHGGDVWAEGEVDKRAVFYFTLQ